MTVPLTAAANIQIDLLLEGVASSLQLTKTLYDDAKYKYLAVTDWLSKPDSPLAPFNPTIYPQGSMRIQTTVKPRAKDEFDLDLVCLLKIGSSVGPAHLFQLVKQRIANNGKYKPILEIRPRCLRLNYAGQFHLDIIPACPNPQEGGTAILIPDRELQSLKNSNPKGYANWFDGRCETGLSIYAKKGIEPLPDNGGQKACLKLITQLTKRHRDVVYEGDPAAPSSIVLTTLLGNVYCGEVVCADALLHALDEIAALIEQTSDILVISNPVDRSENLAGRWTWVTYRRFCEFVVHFRDRMKRLLTLNNMQHVKAGLETLFGEAPTRASIQALVKKMNDDRASGRLRVGGTVATLVSHRGVKVPPNTFHGD